MTVEITRDLIIERVGRVKYDRFLFYLMGPYKSFNLNYVLSKEERREIDIGDLPSPLRRLFEARTTLTRRRRSCGEFRVNFASIPG